MQLGTVAGGNASASTDSCYVIDSPQQLFNCKVDVPYQSRIKINGSYTFPLGIQVAAVAQSNPGANYTANLAYSSATIQPSLGRPLSAGATATVTIPLAKPVSLYGSRINQLDVRATKIFRFGNTRIQGNVDAYNVFNVNTPVTIFGTYNAQVGPADAGARRTPGEVQRAARFLRGDGGCGPRRQCGEGQALRAKRGRTIANRRLNAGSQLRVGRKRR